MATCKDCIHYEVCQYHIDEETKMTVNECFDFKDKSRYIEVVCCEDCVHRNPYGTKCLRDNLWHNSDDFCSYGVKSGIVFQIVKKLTYDEFIAELGNLKGITEHNLKAMYEAYIDDNATE